MTLPPRQPPAPPLADEGPVPLSQPLRVAALSARKPARFDLRPNAVLRARIAAYLNLTAISTLRCVGEVRPIGRHDYQLEAELTATVEQPCGLTLVPVVTKLHEKVIRRYVADMKMPDADEVEMPEDDTSDPLGEVIDPGHVTVEALALALPLYPRAPGATLTDAVFAEPGVAPLRDADLRPFAGLAALKDKLAANPGTDQSGALPGAAKGAKSDGKADD